MIAWREVEGDVGPQPVSTLYRQLPLLDVLRIAGASGPLPVVLLSRRVHEAVAGHLRSSEHERGGLLVGTAWHDAAEAGFGRIRAVSVVECVAATAFASSAVSLRLDSDVWNRARAHLHDGRMVVGWYHSHPHLGAFFSAVDRRTQQAFFHHAWSIGWVIDPFRGDDASLGRMFVGADADEVCSGAVWRMP